VVFAGDSAHIVSPFGARGGNGGIQDVDNLAWKLAAVVSGAAPESLIATYDEERIRGADENILNSSRSTSFMTPKSLMERIFREEVLAMAATAPFARRLVNSGRLSEPCSLAGLSLQSNDDPDFASGLPPGSPCLDAPVCDASGKSGWLLEHLGGDFVLLGFGEALPATMGLRHLTVVPPGAVARDGGIVDCEGLVAARYGVAPGAAYLIRPDQHVAARFLRPNATAVTGALARASGKAMP
jgi:3-(3-hydroxy-phenyl)propionate hydroxylase